MADVVVVGAFDGLRAPGLRFLEEAAKLGPVHALLWADEVVRALTGEEPRFPAAERHYVLDAVRYVERVTMVRRVPTAEAPLPGLARTPAVWAVPQWAATEPDRAYRQAHGIIYRELSAAETAGFPPAGENAYEQPTASKKVLVTGCYDWFHSGHVRFFEEVSALGDLYVVVGNDANVEHLKGAGHPMFKQDERRYIVGSIRFVTQALISSGMGWMDAAPEIARVGPDIYAVNEDGDKPEKRAFCAEHGLEYVVLERLPREGLEARSSTGLRGF